MNEIITKKRVPALFVTVPELLDNMREPTMPLAGTSTSGWTP